MNTGVKVVYYYSRQISLKIE